ncbi:lantibiotic dehydratase [Streptomyces sp. enrichment culture]|uniref:lantibiotic dehydratase n=1 Tax=Streptomyces sp. enrichment culture TaxID=1795815 RepID=UPI003F55214E
MTMYEALDAALLRATARPLTDALPPWPDLAQDDVPAWTAWITEVWSDEAASAAIEVASPLLADAVRGVISGKVARPRPVRRAVASLMRYLLRSRYRATPFGLFAGPAPIRTGASGHARWGAHHRIDVRADAEWLAAAIASLENIPGILQLLPVVADPTHVIRGAKVTVPHQPGKDGPAEKTMRRTKAIETILALAASPITVAEIIDKLHGDYPTTPVEIVENTVRGLISHRIILTSLRAPMTCDDPLDHLVQQLDLLRADRIPAAAAIVAELRRIRRLLRRHLASPPAAQRDIRDEATRRMTAVTGVATRTLVVTSRPDCDVRLPAAVAREAQTALAAIARISPYPAGPPAWQDYRTRFLERYSMGALVPVRDLTDPDIGLGFPAGYRGSVLKRPVLATTRRDEHLLALAQDAAQTNRREIALTREDIDALTVGSPWQVPAHVELCFSVHAPSLHALNDGRFELSIVGLSLAAGTTTGRFLPMLEPDDRERMQRVYTDLPTLTEAADRAQVSSPPLRLRTQNVSRSPAVVPHLLSLGEHNPVANLDLDDLGVGADSRRLYLASLSTGRIIEPSVMNAVEPTNATHPLVRFVTEAHRSHTAVLAPFAWGAASSLPFLPEVRIGRTILSPACWRLRHHELARDGAERWPHRFEHWRAVYGVPRTVFLGTDDQRLRLDLSDPAHQQLLRLELERTRRVTVHEAPPEAAYGWLGRAHEVTMPFAATQRPVRRPTPTTVVPRSEGRLPGASPWTFLKLYSHPARATELLTAALPTLMDTWDPQPAWWFTRYSDPDPHLRIRIQLPDAAAFGDVAQAVGAWAAQLRLDGLLRRVQWDTDEPETGRYGTGRLLAAAEQVFIADSAAARAQMKLRIPAELAPAVTAASFHDIATVFAGSADAARVWLLSVLPQAEGAAPPRAVQTSALYLAAPDRSGLLEVPGGSVLIDAWARRRAALESYRDDLSAAGRDPLDVLPSLLHMHHNRAAGLDPEGEADCRRLARTIAVQSTARAEGAR